MFREIGLTQVFVLIALLFTLYRVRKGLPGSALRAWHERGSAGGPERWRRILMLEFLELALAGVFLLVGGAKLIGRPDMVALFRDIGVGQWFRYVTGTIEIAGAALLILPRLTGGSAVLLGGVMVAATLIEFLVLHRPPVAALTCLGGHTFVAWARISRRHHAWLSGNPAAPRERAHRDARDWKAAYRFAHNRREYRGRSVGLGWRATALTPPSHENRPQ
jgi:uncharacterized membrane protein YphA (DoxX/SURF4 family)